MLQPMNKEKIIPLKLQDGDVLTGTMGPDAHIIIASGATVTLRNVDITRIPNDAEHLWAGITCEGDAILIIESINRVQGGDGRYPGIYIAPGHTLTLRGTGSIESTSGAGVNGMGAGIGGGSMLDCGNIKFESGNLRAIGGYQAAGIGGGYGARCGDIAIFGGTVEAYGGPWAAAIGGSNTVCGDITVSLKAHVTALPGRKSRAVIGMGSDSGSVGRISTDEN